MKQFRTFISQNGEKFILFVSGVLVSAVVSSLLEKVVTWSQALLIFATILVAVVAVYFLRESYQRLQSLTDKMDITVHYIEEPFREALGVKFKGLAYAELKTLVSDAKNELLVFVIMSDKRKTHVTDEHPVRVDYLRALEETIIKRRDSGFKYVRINQVPGDGNNVPVTEYFSKSTIEHFRNVLELEQCDTSPTPKLSVSIMKVPSPIMPGYSFMLLDRRYLGLEMYGVDTKGDLYAGSWFFFEDRGGKLIERFLRQFDNLQRLAQPLTLAELTAAKQLSAHNENALHTPTFILVREHK